MYISRNLFALKMNFIKIILIYFLKYLLFSKYNHIKVENIQYNTPGEKHPFEIVYNRSNMGQNKKKKFF